MPTEKSNTRQGNNDVKTTHFISVLAIQKFKGGVGLLSDRARKEFARN
jgi:hypothetical protein